MSKQVRCRALAISAAILVFLCVGTPISAVAQERLKMIYSQFTMTNSATWFAREAGLFEKHPWEAWERAVNLTLRSAVELTRAVLPGMRERKWGRIINITSIAAKQPVDMLILSNSVRAAVTGFARTLANEVATDGVTVNNILPGYTRTERVEQLADTTAAKEGIPREDVIARFEREIPMRRLGEPSEFAALAVFLASRQASYITGQSIAVDGGWIKSLL